MVARDASDGCQVSAWRRPRPCGSVPSWPAGDRARLPVRFGDALRCRARPVGRAKSARRRLTLSVMADLGLSRLLEPPALPPATDEASDLLGAAADEPRLTHAASSASARSGRPGGCPRCADAALVDARCRSCGGELWGAAALEAFARDRLHLDGAEGVRELAASAPDVPAGVSVLLNDDEDRSAQRRGCGAVPRLRRALGRRW